MNYHAHRYDPSPGVIRSYGKLAKFRKWLLDQPVRVAIFIFLMFVPLFLLLRFLFHTEYFLTNLWTQLEWALGIGAFGAIVGYLLARIRKSQ